VYHNPGGAGLTFASKCVFWQQAGAWLKRNEHAYAHRSIVGECRVAVPLCPH
jgi:hypothetical protein